MINKLYKIVFLCVVLLCFKAYGEEPAIRSDILSKYKNLPEYIEIANLRWKIGFAAYFTDDVSIDIQKVTFQVPLLLELQVPFSVESSNFKWLVQMGGGWMRKENRSYYYVEEECDPFFTSDPLRGSFGDDFFGDRFNDDFFGDHYKRRNKKMCRKRKRRTSQRRDYAYFLFQPGLMYDFGLLTGFLRGGILVGGPKTVGFIASVSVGGLDWWDVGIQAIYYDRFYFGLALTIGSSLKKWQVQNPYGYKEDIFNSN